MSTPLVSICLPNLNTISFLQERVDTIFQQTYNNWELIVSDNFSEDGSWEFFKRLAQKDKRISIDQAPREGLYANWNNCINRSQGKYIYIATSDDTMALNCIEMLVRALERHQECDLAHCKLKTIEPQGGHTYHRWAHHSTFAKSSRELFNKAHLRRAPFDGLLHLLGENIYLSITQLLIRRELFESIGLFESKWGSEGDFNWEMRAAIATDTIHVPDTWGGYRVHKEQATAQVDFGSFDHYNKIEEMIENAISRSMEILKEKIDIECKPGWWRDAKEMRTFFIEQSKSKSSIKRKAFTLKQALKGSRTARLHLMSRILGKPVYPYMNPKKIEKWLSRKGIAPVLIPV